MSRNTDSCQSTDVITGRSRAILPPVRYSPLLTPPDSGRGSGIHLVAGKGSGKSTYLGRGLVWEDFRRGIPTVVIDPVGAVIDHFLDRVTRLPRQAQERCWPRIRYIDMAGGASVFPFPLYYRLATESLTARGTRYVDAIRRLNPELQSASIQPAMPEKQPQKATK